MGKRGVLVGLAVAAALAGSARAADPEPVARHVIALVEGSEPHPETGDVVHAVLEMPLNHHGMVVYRHGIANGPPPAAWLDDARAVLTYFSAETPPEDWLWPWLEDEVRARGVRVIHFGEFGPLAREPERLARWLEPFGLAWDEEYVAGPIGLHVAMRSAETCRFEGDPRARAVHRGPRNRSGENRVWVETWQDRVPDDRRAGVVTGPWGGLALDPWAIRLGGDDQGRRWHLDPFLFLEEALGLAGVPAPHPAVLNGRRMWLLQIDGDGFDSLSTLETDALAAKVMYDEVLTRYRLPYTVSIIVRSLTDDYEVAEPTEAMRMARRIFALPNVEPASHGVLHTLKWRAELQPGHPLDGIAWYRKLENYEYGPVAEVQESIRFVNERLTAPRNPCRVMLWTGYANPYEDAIDAVTAAGCVNLNGGVFRWDAQNDSVGFVSPWSRRVGDAIQVYAGAANENDFDGFFTTMPGAFAHIDTTIERTGTPRILKPADIYIHFYSAEGPARLQVVHDLIRRWAFEEPTAPVFASTYSRAVTSAVRGARILRTADGWAFRGFGDCRSVRIDGETRAVDFARSEGLLGACRRGTSLFLHLARPDARVTLADGPSPRPHVVEANCLLNDARLGPDHVAVTAVAQNRRVVVFGGFHAGARVRVAVGAEACDTVAADGTVTVELETPGRTRILVFGERWSAGS